MQVGDRFPVEDVGLSKGDGPAVAYFYAQAGTDGCTLAAHEFNRSYPRLREAGVRLIGDTRVYVAAGEEYELENHGPEELVVTVVEAPQEHRAPIDPSRRTVRYADQPALEAGADREIRSLVNEDVGCLDVTQFVGVIPPGRAPTHSHSYDGIVYTIDGDGIRHMGGEERVIGPGSAMHLPPLMEHCLENTGKGSMRVLGVFHPSGAPASRAYESE